jgi:NtrC-family two-component system sensor histidine kinase KinB
MRFRRLQTRFILGGALLVATTVACGLWSALTFARLGAVVDQTLRESQETIDLAAVLAGTLEREDDALLLSLTGAADRARRDLVAQRERFDEAFTRLLPLLRDPTEEATAAALRRHAETYRAAGDALIAAGGQPDARSLYHERVNPVLRRAVGACEKLRELNFQSMQAAGVRARDEARRATLIVAALAASALVLSTVVSIRLARSVLQPIRAMTASVDAVSRGDFDRRVAATSADELGQLAGGFNRMAQSLADYRRSSLGELLAAKQTLEATLNALPDAVLVLDPAGQVVAANPLAHSVLQAAPRAGAARLEELPLSDDHRQAVRDALQGRQHPPGQTEFHRALTVPLPGGRRKFQLTAVPIPEFLPKRHGAVVVLDDVTEFARLDELRSELIAVASHELKTPLTTLRLNLLLLDERAENLTPRQREIVSTAILGCEELAGTIDELLDLTRIEAGHLRLEEGAVDLGALLARAISSLQPRFDDAAISLRVQHEGPRALVRGDAARLGIVFQNVLGNAVKYTPRGGTVTVRVSSGQNAGVAGPGTVQIAVTDTGPGIPAEFRERVFEKFFRVEHQRPDGLKSVRGAGIGLYLCRQIVEAHGGAIRCEAGEDGRGTRIAIHLRAAS